jgi:integrase
MTCHGCICFTARAGGASVGLFTRPDSPYWWLFLETTKQKERTDIRLGETTAQRKDSRKLALDRYHQRMNDLAARLYRLVSATPAIRFAKYAAPYATDVIAHRKGARRETELLAQLVAFFGDDLLTTIDQDRVRAYHTHRRTGRPPVAAVTVNREVDLLKGMLRDAVPKYLTVSPLTGMKRLRIVPPRRRFVTDAEFARLLAVCEDAQDCAVLLLGRDPLIRLGDILDLQRTDREGPWLFVRDPKSGSAYEVALSPRCQAALDALTSDDNGWLFPKFRKAQTPRDWSGSVRQRLEYLCRQATPPLPYGRTKHGITFHWGTRRSGATEQLLDRQVPLPSVQKQGNWKTPDVLLKIYAEARAEDQLRAAGALPKRRRKAR